MAHHSDTHYIDSALKSVYLIGMLALLAHQIAPAGGRVREAIQLGAGYALTGAMLLLGLVVTAWLLARLFRR